MGKNIPTTYHDLIVFYPVRPIHDEIEYDNAVKVVEWLAGLERMNPDQEDYFDLLTDQIEKYDNEHYSVNLSERDPIAALSFLLEENGMSSSDLGHLLGNRQLGSKILRGKRQLSKNHIRILSNHFRVSADLFL